MDRGTSSAGPHDTVIEIGVGLGFLTRELARSRERSWRSRLSRASSQSRSESWREATLVASGRRALTGDAWHRGFGGGGRLPEAHGGREPAVFGVGSASHSSRSRGGCRTGSWCWSNGSWVSVCAESATTSAGARAAQGVFEARLLRDVPSGLPAATQGLVVSGLARAAPRPPEGLEDPAARPRYARFVQRLFGQRRKTLRTTVAAAAELGLAPPGSPRRSRAARRAAVTEELVALWRSCEGSLRRAEQLSARRPGGRAHRTCYT